MKYDHNVIKDLLPLYIDDVLSDSSRQIVDEHLDECEDCREYLNDLKESNKEDIMKYKNYNIGGNIIWALEKVIA